MSKFFSWKSETTGVLPQWVMSGALVTIKMHNLAFGTTRAVSFTNKFIIEWY